MTPSLMMTTTTEIVVDCTGRDGDWQTNWLWVVNSECCDGGKGVSDIDIHSIKTRFQYLRSCHILV